MNWARGGAGGPLYLEKLARILKIACEKMCNDGILDKINIPEASQL